MCHVLKQTKSKWLKLDPYSLQQKCSPKNLFFSMYHFLQYSNRLMRADSTHLFTIPVVQHCATISAESEMHG